MHSVTASPTLHIFGIELRTSNTEASQTIPPHWQRFGEEAVLTQIPGKLSEDVFAVYTNFANAGRNNEGSYSLVIGAQVHPDTPLPAGLTRAVVPASARAVFPVEQGRFDKVGETWQAIWGRSDLNKTFVADYEHYRPDGRIDVLVGVTEHPIS